jgi:putative ABC transport system permease protein
MMADVRLAVRSLLKNRGFAAVALVTIALGVGANTAVFSVLNAALLRPLPFSDPERLVAIYETAQRATVERRSVSYPAFQDWHHELRSFDSVAVFDDEGFTVVAGGVAERERGERVSASYFDLLGERPLLGRTFTTSEDVAGQGCSVVLGEALWRRRFEADRGIIGRSLAIDAKSCTVLGVMPQSFSGVSDRAGLWLPITVMTPRDVLENRGNRGMSVVARLRADVTIESARAELAALSLNLRRQYPRELSDRSADLGPLRDEYVGDVRPTLLVLLGAVAFVLLIACTNVANLMLARAASRQREMAIRTALGANRRRLLRQILTESMVLSIAGGISGLLMAAWAADLLVAYNPDPFPSFVSIRVDPRVLAFTFALCVAAGLLFGAVPALAMTRGDITIGLKEGARDSSQGDSPRLHQMLVMSEIALAVVLLTGAGLMLRTIGALRSFDPGFRREGLISARVSLAEAAYSTTASVRFAEQLLGRVRALPTVESATIASDVPSGTSSTAQTVSIEGRDAGAPRIRVYTHRVTPGFFRTIGTPLLAGRDFTERDIDRHDALGTAIISQRMARRHWGDTSPLSERLRLGERLYTVVGVVGDVRHRALVEEPTADPDVYFPLAQIPTRNLAVLARTTGSPDALAQAIRVEVHRLDPAVPVYALATGPELLSTQTSVARFGTFLLGTFALLALLLTIVGIYGVTAYTVSRQARQIGIRMALGATRRDVLRLVLGSGMTVIVAGLTAGTAAAMALTRLLTSLMYGVSPTDPLTFGGATTVLTAAALLACVAPARKAIKIEPALALRSE